MSRFKNNLCYNNQNYKKRIKVGLFGSLFKDEQFLIIEGIYTTDTIPNRKVKKSLGFVSYVKKGIEGNIIDKIEDIYKNFFKLAKEKGANAIINTRLTTGTYQKQGSGWNSTYIIIYGEAVLTEKI
jgi:uncharacterized protein YbjQ (UPF0145 family)